MHHSSAENIMLYPALKLYSLKGLPVAKWWDLNAHAFCAVCVERSFHYPNATPVCLVQDKHGSS